MVPTPGAFLLMTRIKLKADRPIIPNALRGLAISAVVLLNGFPNLFSLDLIGWIAKLCASF